MRRGAARDGEWWLVACAVEPRARATAAAPAPAPLQPVVARSAERPHLIAACPLV